MRLRFTFASRRALSSVGQSRRLIISWSQVQALQGAQFGEVNRLQNASACVSLPSVSTEAELRRAFSSAGSERSPHTREVTGSSPVLPTTQRSPVRKCGVFCWLARQACLDAGSQNKTKRTSSAGLLKGCGSLSPCVHRAKRSSPVDSFSSSPKGGEEKSPAPKCRAPRLETVRNQNPYVTVSWAFGSILPKKMLLGMSPEMSAISGCSAASSGSVVRVTVGPAVVKMPRSNPT